MIMLPFLVFIDPASVEMIYRKNDHIGTDCGMYGDKSLGCICHDTIEGLYSY